MNRYTLSTGETIYTNLTAKEALKRMNRLDILRVLVEGYVFNKDDACYNELASSIYYKALKAYNKLDDFTGIIKLTFSEKDWLGYMLESDMLDEEEKEVIHYYVDR